MDVKGIFVRPFIFGPAANFVKTIIMRLENPRFEQKITVEDLINTTSGHWPKFVQDYELVFNTLRL